MLFVHSRSKYLDCFQKHCVSQLTFQLQRHFSLYIKVLKMSRTISPYGWNQIVIIPHSLCTYGPSFVTINTVKVSLPSLKALQTKPTFACSFSFPPPSPDLSDATQPRCVSLCPAAMRRRGEGSGPPCLCCNTSCSQCLWPS